MTNRYLGPSLILAFLTLIIISCNRNDQENDLEKETTARDSIQELLQEERRANDSLQDLINSGSRVNPPKIFFGREFRDLEDPEEHVKQALMDQPEMIPLKPVLGGTMEFRQITVLTDKWVMAYYDDGHIEGKSIYEFELNSDGSVNFELVTSDHPE